MLLAELVNKPALWGFLGAFVYAAPHLSTCLFASKHEKHNIGECLLNFAVALIIGAISGASIGPWFANWRGITELRDINAICVVIGLTANQTAPVINTFAPKLAGTVLTVLKGKTE